MPTDPKQDDDSADGFWYPPEVIAEMLANPPQPNTLFGVPVIHCGDGPRAVEVTFKHRFLIEEGDAHRT